MPQTGKSRSDKSSDSHGVPDVNKLSIAFKEQSDPSEKPSLLSSPTREEMSQGDKKCQLCSKAHADSQKNASLMSTFNVVLTPIFTIGGVKKPQVTNQESSGACCSHNYTHNGSIKRE